MTTESQQDIIHLKDEFHRIYPVFLQFTDQMKNRGKDGYGKSVGFFPLKGSIFTEFSPFEIVKLRARKSLRSSYTFALLLSPRLQHSSYLWAGNFKSVSKVIHKMYLCMQVCMRKEIKHKKSNERDKLMTTVTIVTSQNGQCRGEHIQNQDVGPTRYI